MADNPHRGSTLDSFLEKEGVLSEFQARAIKEVKKIDAVSTSCPGSGGDWRGRAPLPSKR